tara:strand:+ start:212 stop:532 length:321 start_codon:yes stop_codon:yes gene_type:complete
MPRVTFVQQDETEQTVDVDSGRSLMAAAVENGVAGILAECGGSCACATCHVYLDSEWNSKFPHPAELELGMLEGAIDPDERSRLACQLTVEDLHDGIRVHLPADQI